METLENLNLYDVNIEDEELEIPNCRFFMDENHKNSNEPYNRYLQIISKEIKVVEYNEKNNTAIIGLSNFIHDNINVLDDIFDIPSHDIEDEYLNVLVAMINGYESKLFYNAFCEAYDAGRFHNFTEEKETINSILDKCTSFNELEDSCNEILEKELITDSQYDKIFDIIEEHRKNFIIYLHDWEECCGGDSPQESEYVENTVKEILEEIKKEEKLKESEEEEESL